MRGWRSTHPFESLVERSRRSGAQPRTGNMLMLRSFGLCKVVGGTCMSSHREITTQSFTSSSHHHFWRIRTTINIVHHHRSNPPCQVACLVRVFQQMAIATAPLEAMKAEAGSSARRSSLWLEIWVCKVFQHCGHKTPQENHSKTLINNVSRLNGFAFTKGVRFQWAAFCIIESDS